MNSQVAADSFWKRRGMAGNHARPRSLDLESRQEFLSGFRDVIDTALQKTAWQRAHEIAELRQMRIDEPRPLFELVELFAGDPVISTSVRTWLDTQDLIWQVDAPPQLQRTTVGDSGVSLELPTAVLGDIGLGG